MPALTDKHLHSLLANSNFISVKRIPFFSSVYLYYIFNRYYYIFSFVNVKLGKGRYFRTEESDALSGRLGDRAAPPAGASDGHRLREGPGSSLKAQFREAGSGGRGPGSQRGSGEKPTEGSGWEFPARPVGRGRAPAPPAHAYRRAGASAARPPLLGGLRQSLAGPGGWSSPRGPVTGRHWLRHPGPHHLLPPRSGRAAAAAASGGGAARGALCLCRRVSAAPAGGWRARVLGGRGSRGGEPSTPSPPGGALRLLGPPVPLSWEGLPIPKITNLFSSNIFCNLFLYRRGRVSFLESFSHLKSINRITFIFV